MSTNFKKLLLISSLILNVVFIAIALSYVIKNKESLTQKFLWKFNTETIIMFGDSHTANGQWNKLLNRCDVLNLGFSGFTSDQLKFTMKQYIVERNAQWCFIQCGGNDLNNVNFNPILMRDNIQIMIDYLKSNNIEPVLQSLFHRPDQEYNLTIDSLNTGLENLAKANHIDFIDVNKQLDVNKNIGEHVLFDNIHLNNKGYEIWGQVLKEYLMEKGID